MTELGPGQTVLFCSHGLEFGYYMILYDIIWQLLYYWASVWQYVPVWKTPLCKHLNLLDGEAESADDSSGKAAARYESGSALPTVRSCAGVTRASFSSLGDWYGDGSGRVCVGK